MSQPRARILAFDGVVNFRDFGGYPTRDGRMVTFGKLFRSAHFNEVTSADAARLDALGVRSLVDLRRQHEADDAPNRWSPARVVFHDPDPPAPPPPIEDEYSAELARATMKATYARFVGEARFLRLFGDLLRGLAEEGGPVIVHCAAGKDRTGIACALVLHALGVDRETIFADYELTNATLDYEARARLVRARLEPRVGKPLSDEAIAPVIGVERIYLESALDAIERDFGTLDRYIADALGLDARRRAALQARLLTNA